MKKKCESKNFLIFRYGKFRNPSCKFLFVVKCKKEMETRLLRMQTAGKPWNLKQWYFFLCTFIYKPNRAPDVSRRVKRQTNSVTVNLEVWWIETTWHYKLALFKKMLPKMAIFTKHKNCSFWQFIISTFFLPWKSIKNMISETKKKLYYLYSKKPSSYKFYMVMCSDKRQIWLQRFYHSIFIWKFPKL